MTLPRILNGILTGVLVTILLFMMVLTTVDVIGRDLMNAPLPSAYELTQLLMAASIFVALPLVTAGREHVTIAALDGFSSGAADRVRTLFINLVSAAVVGGLAWRLFLQGDRLAESGNVTMFLRAPLAPVAYGGSVLLAASALIFLVLAVLPRPAPSDGTGS